MTTKNTLIHLSKLLLIISATAAISYYSIEYQNDVEAELGQNIQEAIDTQAQLRQQYEDVEFQAHLVSIEQKSLSEAKKQIEEKYTELTAELTAYKSEERNVKLDKIEAVFSLFKETNDKISRNQSLGIKTETISSQTTEWGVKFLNEEFDTLKTDIETAQSTLDNDHREYLATLPTPTPTPKPYVAPPVAPAEGYSYQTVSNSRGTFGVYLIKMSLSSVQVKTVTANSDNCSNNCPAKTLADLVSENGAYAGMNGTYFCPPDYASCANKTYSYDFGTYNSYLNKWLNQHALSWNDLGLFTFNGNSASFFKDSKNYSGGAVTAGISNFPSLLENGNVVVNEGALSSYQRDVRGSRGAIGVDDSNVYLAIINGATVPDAAYVMQSLGAKHALNLDGGGSSALFIAGSYKVGPGRLLPNAILLVK